MIYIVNLARVTSLWSSHLSHSDFRPTTLDSVGDSMCVTVARVQLPISD
jgi:hypothetical protein